MQDIWFTSTPWAKRKEIKGVQVGKTVEAFYPTVIVWVDETHLQITVPSNDDTLNIYERIGLPSHKTGDHALAFMKDIQPGIQYLFELPPTDKPFGLVFKRETNPDEAIIFVHK